MSNELTLKALGARVAAQDDNISQILALLQAKAGGEASQAKRKASPPAKTQAQKAKAQAERQEKERAEITGPFSAMNEKQVSNYLLTVFQERNKDTGIWFFHNNIGRTRAVWSMAHHLTYLTNYTFSDKAAGYAQVILATDSRNEEVLKALKRAKKL